MFQFAEHEPDSIRTHSHCICKHWFLVTQCQTHLCQESPYRGIEQTGFTEANTILVLWPKVNLAGP